MTLRVVLRDDFFTVWALCQRDEAILAQLEGLMSLANAAVVAALSHLENFLCVGVENPSVVYRLVT